MKNKHTNKCARNKTTKKRKPKINIYYKYQQ